MTALCVTNMALGCVGILEAVAKFSNRHPFGFIGCGATFWAGSTLAHITMTIQALISYERRKVITSISIATFSTRLYVILTGSIVFISLFWAVMYWKLATIKYLDVQIEKNSTETIQVCALKSHLAPGLLEVVLAVTALILPGSVIMYNYW